MRVYAPRISWVLAIACGLVLLPASPARPASEVPQGLRCLVKAYPTQLCGATATTLEWCDGTSMPYASGATHTTHDELLDRADLKAQMSMRYPPGRDYQPPKRNEDPGRVRHEPFFLKMYGDSAKAVGRHTATVRWLDGRKLHVTTINGVDKKLKAVADEVRALPRAIRDKVTESSGTFVWRRIKGTSRLSMHSFALAIDVGVKHSDYWKWHKPGGDALLSYRNRIPLEVVEIFERHGFIWGGKWYHYDTMHFEYRPELLVCE